MNEAKEIAIKVGKVLAFILASALLGYLMAMIIGLILPEKEFIERRKSFNYPNDIVWEVITDVESYKKWKPDVKKVETLGTDDDDMLQWREYYKGNRFLLYKMAKLRPEDYFSYDIIDKNKANEETWIYQIVLYKGKTVLKLKRYTKTPGIFQRFEKRYLDNKNKEVDKHLLYLNERLRALNRLR